MSLPDIEDLFPHEVGLKHKGQVHQTALAVMKWLEAHKIMVHTNFYLDMQEDPDRVIVRFRSKKHAKRYKEVKKGIRDGAAS